MARQNRGNQDRVVAVGQVGDVTVQVIQVTESPDKFVWRLIEDDGRKVQVSEIAYATIEEAMDIALKIVVPDAIPVEFNMPDEKDFEALNALLFCGGLSEDLTSFQEVVDLHIRMLQARDAIVQVKEKAQKDLEQARLIISSTHGPFHDATLNVSSISGVFVAQCDVLQQITERTIDTLRTFIVNFLKE